MPNFIERPRFSCALAGALVAANSLPRTIPILHAPTGCGGSAANTYNAAAGFQSGAYCGGNSVPSSNIHEREVVFGGDKRLREQIANTLKVMDGDLYFLLTSCVTDVIGDDIRAIVSDFRAEGYPIIAAETGGFKGNAYYGYDQVLQALFKQLVQPGIPKVKGRVNLWGIPPRLDAFWRGNLEGIRLLLEKLGLQVNSFFTVEDNLEGIRTAAAAELNIVASDVHGVGAARVFYETHGTPYVAVHLPIGPTASDELLRSVGASLGLDAGLVEKVIQRENDRYYRLFASLIDPYYDLDMQRYAVVVGDANYSTAISRFLIDDLGWLAELVVCTDQLDEQQQDAVSSRVAKPNAPVQPKLVFDTNGSEIRRHFDAYWPQGTSEKYKNSFSPGFVVGSAHERDFANYLGANHLSVSFPVLNRVIIDRGYTGYRGGLRLVEDLTGAIVANR